MNIRVAKALQKADLRAHLRAKLRADLKAAILKHGLAFVMEYLSAACYDISDETADNRAFEYYRRYAKTFALFSIEESPMEASDREKNHV